MPDTPNLHEATLGVFLHDIGKFLQRAYGSSRKLPPEVLNLEPVILPTGPHGYTHKHVLGTELFFHWLETEAKTGFPAGIRPAQVRNVAVYHHNPDSPAAWLCTEADRLSSGMDRKRRDEELEGGGGGWDQFIKTPLRSPFASVDIGLGKPPAAEIRLQALEPGENLMPEAGVNAGEYQKTYGELWLRFQEELKAILRVANREVFFEALLSLSERYLFAVPSSTVDEPDISLHDHARTAAAIAAAMYQWHEDDGSLDDAKRIRDRELPKFRFLAGDLSGIQGSLFCLANQQVKGVNKILRARSFLLSMTMEAAALACRNRLGLPALSVVQNAGGRFLMLAANTPEAATHVSELREEIDEWMMDRYLGEVSLNLALGEPFAGSALLREEGTGRGIRFQELMRKMDLTVDSAKQRPLVSAARTIHSGLDYSLGPCCACGVRPGRHAVAGHADLYRCDVCHDEHRIGGALPKMSHLSWRTGDSRGEGMRLFSRLILGWHEEAPDSRTREEACSLVRIYGSRGATESVYALRFLATYVPVLGEHDLRNPAYDALSEDAREAEAGDLKTFEHIAADGLEHDSQRGIIGQPFLGVLKADVDRLGMVFAHGVRNASLSRTAQVSRMMDLFFTGYLHRFLRDEFPNTYTVYAGGDDLLLIAPWKEALALASAMRDRFGRWTGGNPNLTLSAGVELMKVSHPINRVVRGAEERLSRAKEEGGGLRNRVCAIAREPVDWKQFEIELKRSEKLSEYLRSGWLAQSFVYRILRFDEERRLAEGGGSTPGKLDLNAASWRARWGYQLARNIIDGSTVPAAQKEQVIRDLNELLGLKPDHSREREANPAPRIAVSVALYRNRKPSGRS